VVYLIPLLLGLRRGDVHLCFFKCCVCVVNKQDF
jgi:hypothetical protein